MIRINHWGIKARVVFLAIAPVLLVTTVLAVYSNMARNSDLDQESADKGSLIATNLASAMEFAVATNNLTQIQHLADASASQDAVVAVSVTDLSGKRLYSTVWSEGLTDKIQRYKSKIVSTGIDIEDLYSQESGDDRRKEKVLGFVEVYISSKSHLERQRNIYLTTAFIAVLGLFSSIGMALLIGRGVTRPVHSVIDTVSALSRGRLDARMHETYGGEFGELRDGLNAMAETIQHSQAKLISKVNEAVIDLEYKIVELEEKNRELDIARTEAMQAKDAKSDFLANMSHEIRTPLNAVVGFSRQLAKGELNSQQEECTRAISSAAHQLLTVIDDILSFSKIESGKLEIKRSEFNLRDCLEDTVLMLGQEASEKAIEMVLLIDADVPDVILGDADRISQVIVNLVNNAIKFTDEGSIVIHLKYALDDGVDAIHLSVSDTGSGISHEAQKNIFSSFYQENQKFSKRHGGTGLGLVICKRLVELMGGEIGFSSEPGRGTEFYFRIPIEIVADHSHLSIESPVKVFLVDGHNYSRRAIRNTLVHMGVSAFAVESKERLLYILSTINGDHDNDIVMISLPAGYELNKFADDYLKPVRGIFSGRIIVLVTGDYSDVQDIAQMDGRISVLGKPLRSQSLQTILSAGQSAGHVESNGQHQDGKHDSYSTRSILVAEDNEFNQRYINVLLSTYGVETVCVDTGTRAVEACKAKHFDLILMDLHMPELDGIEAARQIRALPGVNADTPIVAITADVFANDNNRLIDEGFTDFMFKPVCEDRLAEVINTYIATLPGQGSATIHSEKLFDNALPDDMVEKLFNGLYEAYAELTRALTEKSLTESCEAVHKVLGLVCYFKVGHLAEVIRHLQDVIKESDFCSASSLLFECMRQTREMERAWRAG